MGGGGGCSPEEIGKNQLLFSYFPLFYNLFGMYSCYKYFFTSKDRMNNMCDIMLIISILQFLSSHIKALLIDSPFPSDINYRFLNCPK